jgi:hypothetical protein
MGNKFFQGGPLGKASLSPKWMNIMEMIEWLISLSVSLTCLLESNHFSLRRHLM